MTREPPARRPNRLAQERSPYLLQHAYNPVDWYPWGPEALAKAASEEKPIFLSIGYSTCYWCHVMERESFESPHIAQLLNEHFVPIKVDREERPDLDAIYMSAVTALSGHGGWPMTVFLTPEGQPFWGGTYFPPEDRGGRPGLANILRSIAQAWRTQRRQIISSGQSLTQLLQAREPAEAAGAITREVLDAAVQAYTQQYDPEHGGFGEAPKFPRSHSLSFLLRAWYRSRDARVLSMVESTLEAMARGGLHDHLGGGFHRYATDAQWLVPHFEKMLYDQALLARTYLEAFQVTGKPAYAEVARDIFAYVLRDLRDPGGAYYSAEDAGAVGREGEFYVWSPQEIEAVLGPEEARRLNAVYGVTAEGNFEGRSILHLQQRPDQRFDAARAKLLDARSRRQRPHRDDKILTDWNGLMIAALAYGAHVLGEPRYAQAAARAAAFVLERLQRDGQLLHRFRERHADIPGFLDDYAFLSWGLLELYEATFDGHWLTESRRLTREMTRLFWDDKEGGLFFSGPQNESLIARPKDLYDGAVPSGNSVAALLFVRLGLLTTDHEVRARAEQCVRAFAHQATRAPHAVPQFLIAADGWLGPSQAIVIAGDPKAPLTQQMLRAVASRFLPRAALALRPSDGPPTISVCHDEVCQPPMTDLRAAESFLEALR